jgi:hypothetical protein
LNDRVLGWNFRVTGYFLVGDDFTAVDTTSPVGKGREVRARGWNYLYLSQRILDEENKERRQDLVAAIRAGSVVAWQHINLHGEYDFAAEKLQDSVGLEVPKIRQLEVG